MTPAEKTKTTDARVLPDHLYPIKVGNVNRTAILEENGRLLLGLIEMMETENEVKNASVSWLRTEHSGKAWLHGGVRAQMERRSK